MGRIRTDFWAFALTATTAVLLMQVGTSAEPGKAITMDDGLIVSCNRASASRRNQLRVIVPPHLAKSPFGPDHAKILAFRAHVGLRCGSHSLVSFYTNEAALVNWDGTGGIRSKDESSYLGRVRVDEGKPQTWVASPF